MPKSTGFCSKWLLKLDNTNKVCSRWLTKGKTANSFRCIVCNTDDLSCANGGWTDIKKHSDRPKHIQRMKDVFDSVSLVASGRPSSSTSNNTNDGGVCSITASTDANTIRRPFVTIQNNQRALTHDESKSPQSSFLRNLLLFYQIVYKNMKNYQNVIINSSRYFEMCLDGQKEKGERNKIRSYIYFYHTMQL
jgi:hypothetical protein